MVGIFEGLSEVGLTIVCKYIAGEKRSVCEIVSLPGARGTTPQPDTETAVTMVNSMGMRRVVKLRTRE